MNFITATTFGLGCWQMYRLKWKLDLIDSIQESIEKGPQPFKENLPEFSRVELSGEMLYDKEMVVGPRSVEMGDTIRGSLIITPFVSTHGTLLVNRGLTTAYQKSALPTKVTIDAWKRKGESQPLFVKNVPPKEWYTIDLDQMAAFTGAKPILLELIDTPVNAPLHQGVILKPPTAQLKNNHLEYAPTWFSLSAASFFPFSKASISSIQMFIRRLSRYTKVLDEAGSFSDFKNVKLTAGAGGDGHVSFERTMFKEFGPPSGGTGGSGGSIWVQATKELSCLGSIKNAYVSGPGSNGGNKYRNGKDGKDVVIQVPLGTVVKSLQYSNNQPPIPAFKDPSKVPLESDEYNEFLETLHHYYVFRQGYVPEPDRVFMLLEKLIPKGGFKGFEYDLVNEGEKKLLLKGGRGGYGNTHFMTPTIQGPGMAQKGEYGPSMTIQLELKTIADAGMVGLPNAGKSSLLKAVSNAHPKIAPYPFTTLNPYVGTIDYEDMWTMTIADIPGIIKGAHQNLGLGHRFLRHIERTRILVYVIDLASPNPWDDLTTLQNELEAHQSGLSTKPAIIAANKADLASSKQNYDLLKSKTSLPIVPISAKYEGNIFTLTSAMRSLLESL